MEALVVYTYTDYSDDKKIKVSNDWGYFIGKNPTQNEILNFEERHSRYPDKCSPKIINIIKLDK